MFPSGEKGKIKPLAKSRRNDPLWNRGFPRDVSLFTMDHRDEKGNCDLKYWEKKFNDYSFTETSLYCDGFRELKNDDLITVKWAEGCPYILFPTNKGLSHFEQKKQAERMKRKEKQSSFQTK